VIGLGDIGEQVTAEWLTDVIVRAADGRRTIVVGSPPAVSGVSVDHWVVIPTCDGQCDLWGGLIEPLTRAGLAIVGDGVAADLLAFTTLPQAAADAAEAERDTEDAGDGDLVQRTYHLCGSTVETLDLVAASLADRLGRHVRKSQVVAWALRYTQVLEDVDRVMPSEGLVQRTYHLSRGTIKDLSHVGVLASRVAGRHMRLSAVVDLAIRLFSEMAPLEQERIIDWDRRRRPENRA
jgi:hypothetical protein